MPSVTGKPAAEQTSTPAKAAAVAGGGIGLVWLIAKASDPDTWELLGRISTLVVNFFGANPWAVYVLGGPPAVLFVLFGVGEFLQGAYPKERGEAPRLIAGIIAISRGPKLIVRALGRAVARKSKSFGLDFDEDDAPPAICAWKDAASGAVCGDPFVFHRGKATGSTDNTKGGFCLRKDCNCPGWVAVNA